MSCACNWTSFLRSNDCKVPSIEKYKDDNSDDTKLPKTLEELRDFGESLETGDCLIMHCTHTFGKLAQLGTGSPWDHVAMIVKCNQDDIPARLALINDKPHPTSSTVNPWPKPGEERTEVLEAMAGGSFAYPFTAHAIARGRFCKYTAVRRLRNSHGEPLSSEAQQRIEKFVQEFWGRPYEKGRRGAMEILKPVLKFRKTNIQMKRDKSKETLDRLFCSELIAEAYQAAGILPEETLNSNEILPSMFAPGKQVDKYLEVQSHGYRLGEVEVFKAPETPLNTAINERRQKISRQREDQKLREDCSTITL